MKKIIVWFGISFVLVVVPMQEEFDKGVEFGKFQNDQAEANASNINRENIYDQKFGIPKLRLLEESLISEEAAKHPQSYLEREEGKYGRDVIHMRNARKSFKIDKTEPFLKRANKIFKDPKKHLETTTVVVNENNYSVETCEDCEEVIYFVKGRREKKRYVYLDKPPYIEAGAYCGNHGYLTIKVELIGENDDLFLENGEFNNIELVRTSEGDGSYVDEVYKVNKGEVTLRKTIHQNGHPWIHPRCYLVPALRRHVLSAPEMIKLLLGGEVDETLQWGTISSATLHHREVNDTEQHYWIAEDIIKECEEKAERGECEYEEVVKDPPSDKFWKGKRIRDSWGETVTYSCKKTCKDTCIELKSKGCTRATDPECVETVETLRNGKKQQECFKWRWKFNCAAKKGTKTYKFSGENPFCFGGECIDSTYESDGDFGKAASQLAMLNEIGKNLGNDEGKKNFKIFSGEGHSCTKYILDFSDCCKKRGWGQNLGVSRCNQQEADLALKRGENKCVYVGTHCSKREKLTRTCIQKKSVFCCFGSRFGRILQEQGRSQLGMNFGSSECPDCRGFTVDELTRIDFSKLDLTELYSEVMSNFNVPRAEHYAEGAEFEKIKEQFLRRKREENSDSTEQPSFGQKVNEGLNENIKHLLDSYDSDEEESGEEEQGEI